MDRTRRTYSDTLATQTALGVVDVRHIVLYGDGAKRTLLLTLATTDAGGLTSLHGYRTLVFVDARDEHSPTLWSLLAKLDDATWTSLHTGTAGHTLLFVDLWESRL